MGDSLAAVTVRPCRCGLPPRKVEFGAPHVYIPRGDPKRRRLGLPDKTDTEKAIDSRWV